MARICKIISDINHKGTDWQGIDSLPDHLGNKLIWIGRIVTITRIAVPCFLIGFGAIFLLIVACVVCGAVGRLWKVEYWISFTEKVKLVCVCRRPMRCDDRHVAVHWLTRVAPVPVTTVYLCSSHQPSLKRLGAGWNSCSRFVNIEAVILQSLRYSVVRSLSVFYLVVALYIRHIEIYSLERVFSSWQCAKFELMTVVLLRQYDEEYFHKMDRWTEHGPSVPSVAFH